MFLSLPGGGGASSVGQKAEEVARGPGVLSLQVRTYVCTYVYTTSEAERKALS